MWHTGEEDHFDDRGEPHRDGAQEEGIDRVVDHDGEYLRVESIAQCGYYEGEGEEDDVQNEEDDGEPVQPVGLVGNRNEQDRNYTSSWSTISLITLSHITSWPTHGHREPSVKLINNDISGIRIRHRHTTG